MTVGELKERVKSLRNILLRTPENIRDDLIDGLSGDGTFILDTVPEFILDLDCLDYEAGEMLSDWLEIND